jgi:hypothetical protein
MRNILLKASLGVALSASATIASAAPRLPEGAELRVRTESELSSKTAEVGDTIYLRVSDPVRYNGIIIIPDGARVTGHVSAARHRGVFGRSGKLEIAVDSVKVGEDNIRLRGGKFDKGKGQGTLSIATAVLVAPIAGIITGKSAVIKQGTEFVAYTDQDY